MSPSQIYIVGLDGVPPSLLERAIDSGHVPTLQSLRQTGASGVTRSTIPPISMLAWSTFATGRNPGNHGIFNFMLKQPDGRDYRFANSSILHNNAPTVWEYLDAFGAASGVMNVMPGYPASETRGYHISDHITTPNDAPYVNPEPIRQTINELVDGYNPSLPSDLSTDADASTIQDYLDRFFAVEQDNIEVAEYLLDNFDCPLTTMVLSGPDVLLHNIGHLLDDTHPEFDSGLASRFGETPLDLLALYDDFLNVVTELMDDDDVLFVLSDHGHGTIRKTINLNSWLYQNGYLSLNSSLLTRLKVFGYNHLFDTVETILHRSGLYHLVKRTVARSSGEDNGDLARYLTLSQDDIDWTETDAFTISADGQIYLDTTTGAGDETDGSDPSGAVKSELQEDLLSVRDPDSGEPVFKEILDGSDLYRGEYESSAPDLVAVPQPGYEITFPQTMRTNRVFQRPEKPSSHTSYRERDGIFLCWGADVDATSSVTVPLVDFAPTALALLDLPVPAGMDGDVRGDFFSSPLSFTEHKYDGRVTVNRCIRTIAQEISTE